jgi:hypothetical protein
MLKTRLIAWFLIVDFIPASGVADAEYGWQHSECLFLCLVAEVTDLRYACKASLDSLVEARPRW